MDVWNQAIDLTIVREGIQHSNYFNRLETSNDPLKYTMTLDCP
jgi:hypothetical protein